VKKTQEVGSRIFLTRGRNVASKVFGSNRAWKCVEKQNSLPLKTYKDFHMRAAVNGGGQRAGRRDPSLILVTYFGEMLCRIFFRIVG
jgi:hypothetical protein